MYFDVRVYEFWILKFFFLPPYPTIRDNVKSLILNPFRNIGDAEDVGIPVTNTWYFDGYNTDECFDRYFENPTEHRPPTCYLGFPCTKVLLKL